MLRSQLDRIVMRVIAVIFIVGISVTSWIAYHRYLSHSLIQAAQTGDTARLNVLLARGVDPNTSEADPSLTSPGIAQKDAQLSALEWALKTHHPAAAVALLQKGAKVKTNALGLAGAEPDVKVALALLDRGIDGGTLLGWATFAGNAILAQAMLSRDPALKSVAESKGMLSDAASKGNIELMKALLDGGVGIDVRDTIGTTPLMRAIMTGKTEAVAMLLQNGADVHAVTAAGRTVRDYAVLHGRSELENLIDDAEKNRRPVIVGVQEQQKRAASYYNFGRLAEAIAIWRQLLSQMPGDLKTRSDLVRALWQHKEFQAARKTAQQGVKLAPSSPEAHRALGTICFWQNRPAEAAAEYRIALRLNPKDSTARSYLASALEQQDNLPEAIKENRTLIAQNPGDAVAHYSLGERLYRQGDRDAAVAECRRATELNPRLGAAYVELGWMLLEQGKIPDAVADCKQAVSLLPRDANAHANLGKALTAQGDLAGAVMQCRLALQLDPSDAEVHYNLALALDKQGQRAQATAELQRYLRRASRNPNERERIADAEAHLHQWGVRSN